MLGTTPLTRELVLNRAAYDHWVAFCHSTAGVVCLFLWSVAEAIVWPIVPDSLLIPMAFGGRRRYRLLLGTTVLGAALGGIGLYLFAWLAPHPAAALLPYLPVIQPFMIERTNQAMDQQGVMAFWTQPWSGVSYKVYAILGGARGFDPWLVLPLSIAARGLRMFLNSVVPAVLAVRRPSLVRDYWIYVAVAYLVLFGYVWVSTQVFG